ncbi:MAG: class I SAM-dependent methyltransferase [Bacteroidota bacterium]
MLTPEQFYNTLADQYDGMTRFEDRLAKQRPILSSMLMRFPARRAIDLGCGTGVHAIALAQMGVKVTGVDISNGMLDQARTNAENTGLNVRFKKGDFLTPITKTRFDLLLCLGNSLPHIASRDELTKVFKHWRQLCARDGVLIIQLLNYERVLEKRERIVNIRRDGDDTIIRFYDFLDDALQFNILTLQENGSEISHTLQSTRLTPFTEEDIIAAAFAADFSAEQSYGSLSFDPLTDESADLVVVLFP